MRLILCSKSESINSAVTFDFNSSLFDYIQINISLFSLSHNMFLERPKKKKKSRAFLEQSAKEDSRTLSFPLLSYSNKIT